MSKNGRQSYITIFKKRTDELAAAAPQDKTKLLHKLSSEAAPIRAIEALLFEKWHANLTADPLAEYYVNMVKDGLTHIEHAIAAAEPSMVGMQHGKGIVENWKDQLGDAKRFLAMYDPQHKDSARDVLTEYTKPASPEQLAKLFRR